MAKRQTRRTVSFNRAVYNAILQAANAEGMSVSEWLTQLARARLPELPDSVHVRKDGSTIRPDATFEQRRLHASPRSVVIVSPRRQTTKTEIAIAEIQRRAAGVPAGALCANCVDFKATHMGRVDRTGAVYPLCDACELPKGNAA